MRWNSGNIRGNRLTHSGPAAAAASPPPAAFARLPRCFASNSLRLPALGLKMNGLPPLLPPSPPALAAGAVLEPPTERTAAPPPAVASGWGGTIHWGCSGGAGGSTRLSWASGQGAPRPGRCLAAEGRSAEAWASASRRAAWVWGESEVWCSLHRGERGRGLV